jgi:cAMP phosphodiesterase
MLRIKIVGSAIGDGERHQFLLSYVCNDTVAIDAGSIGFMTPIEDQARIRNVFLTHSHLDHTASLPIFLDNVYAPGPECPNIYAHAETLNALKATLFNEPLWSDLVRLSREESPFLRMQPVADGQATIVDRLTILPVELNHVVPTLGYVISDDQSAIAVISDTGPSEHVWEVLNAVPRLKAVFLEVSFPNSMARVAARSMHLTPRTFDQELAKLRRPVPVIAVHVKPALREQVVREVVDLNRADVEIVQTGRMYEF